MPRLRRAAGPRPQPEVGANDRDILRQVREIRLVAGTKHRGEPIVVVSHGTTIAAVTGITPEPGEMLIVKPQGDGQFELRGSAAR